MSAMIQPNEGRATVRDLPTPTPADMLMAAVEKGASIDQLEKLMALQERWEANNARKAFVAAMTEFKQKPLTVRKDKTVSYSGTSYTHASLAEVVETVVQAMAVHGLSHRWTVEQKDKAITVACIITHNLGHSESVSLTAAADDSGKKNAIQQVASTVSYLERYTLMAACGLASRDMPDDDGRGSELPPEPLDSKVADWCSVMRDAATLAELAERRAEVVKVYTEMRMVPQAVRTAYTERKAALS